MSSLKNAVRGSLAASFRWSGGCDALNTNARDVTSTLTHHTGRRWWRHCRQPGELRRYGGRRDGLDKFLFCSYGGITLSAANQNTQDSDFACVPPAAPLVVRQPACSLAGGLLCPCENSLGGGQGGRHPDRPAPFQPPDPAQGKPAKQPVLLPCARSWPSSRLWRLEPKPIICRSECRRSRAICRAQAWPAASFMRWPRGATGTGRRRSVFCSP